MLQVDNFELRKRSSPSFLHRICYSDSCSAGTLRTRVSFHLFSVPLLRFLHNHQPTDCLPVRLVLLSCICSAFPFRPAADLDVPPRLTVLTTGLIGCRRFSSSALSSSITVLLDAERLYVGARGFVFSLRASDISAGPVLTIEWEASSEQKQQCLSKGKDNKTECFNHIRFLQRFNSTHLYMCGTHAFRPLCAYIDEERFVMSSQTEEGRDKCPYGPTTGYTGLMIDRQMFTASQYEFRSFPDIRRNSPSPTLKTEDAPTRWLNEADFVGSALVRESEGGGTGDDDKIYFFFTERNQEQTTTYSHSRVARVARVCKGDRGGGLTLQKRWTSFLKARLTCSLPEYDFHFNVLRSVFIVHGHTPQDTLFYGIFGVEWKNVKASAVCRFSLPEVQEAFQGPYMENQDSGSKWSEYTGKIPDPRPGTCITDALRVRGINVSTSLPDDVLDFVRRHPLISQQVQPADRRPLLFRRTMRYTHMAVHDVQGLDGKTYHVFYMATDEGWLHKAVEVKGQIHIIEELQLFEEPQPVSSLLISDKQMSVYVGSAAGLVQLPLSSCLRYTSCHDCIFARDPNCAWNGAQCVEITAATDRSALIQDIQHGSSGCVNSEVDMVERSRSVRVGDDVLLQCELSSNLATPLWTLNGGELQGYDLNSGFRTGTDELTDEPDSPPITLPSPSEPPSSEGPLPPPPAPLPPYSELLSPRNMEAMYLSLITILGGLCVVLTVVLIYVGFCLQVGSRGKYSLRAAAAAYPNSKRRNRNRKQQRNSSHMELKTISSHCNGNGVYNGVSAQHNANAQDGGFLQIVPGEDCDFPSGLSATLPSVLRRMNGNSYVLLRQSDADSVSPLCYSFTEELNRMLEKRKHTQLLPRPDESSV
ncbi:hypothetical protein LDENG_00254110 [Lucifuga dentata]|nr:hypothetical protein LDENG_00254110 [Lucifuga dentata]